MTVVMSDDPDVVALAKHQGILAMSSQPPVPPPPPPSAFFNLCSLSPVLLVLVPVACVALAVGAHSSIHITRIMPMSFALMRTCSPCM